MFICASQTRGNHGINGLMHSAHYTLLCGLGSMSGSSSPLQLCIYSVQCTASHALTLTQWTKYKLSKKYSLQHSLSHSMRGQTAWGTTECMTGRPSKNMLHQCPCVIMLKHRHPHSDNATIYLPHVSLASITLPADHFRAHPVGGTSHRANSRPRHADGLESLASTEVSQFHIACRVSQDVSTWGMVRNNIPLSNSAPSQKSERLLVLSLLYRSPGHVQVDTFDVAMHNHIAVKVGHPIKDLLGVLPGHVLC